MKKSDLKTGMVLELMNGTKAVVYMNTVAGNVIIYVRDEHDNSQDDFDKVYDNDLNYIGASSNKSQYHVAKVLIHPSTPVAYLLKPSKFSELVRDATATLATLQVEELTLEQVCKELGREVKIVKG